MQSFFAILLGVVQGLTEFLPVSSTGHLIILEKFFNLSSSQFGLSFDVALHLGTLLALLVYFRKIIQGIIFDFIKGERKLSGLLIIGTLPALIAGFFLEKFISKSFRNPLIVAINLITFSFIFLLAEKIGKKQKEFSFLSIKDSLIIGIFQALAFLPGVSRSGITISGGLFKNLKESQAGEFAFLLSVPIILVASTKDLLDLVKNGVEIVYLNSFILGILVSFLVGFLCIKFFLRYLRKYGLTPFIIYRIILAFSIIYLFK